MPVRRAGVRRASRLQREEASVAPDAGRVIALGEGDLRQLVVERTGNQRFQPVSDKQSRAWPIVLVENMQRMLRAKDDGVAAVELEGDAHLLAFAFLGHGHRAERSDVDVYRQLF